MPLKTVRDLRRVALTNPQSGLPGMKPESGYLPAELPATGPTGDPWIIQTVEDGSAGAGSSQPNERHDWTWGDVFYVGQMVNGVRQPGRYIVDWVEVFPESLPTTNQDRWQVVGPEVHLKNIPVFSQASIMLEIGPDKRRRLNSNAGRPNVKYDDLGPIVVGRAYFMRLEFVHTASDSDGYVRLSRVPVDDPTAPPEVAFLPGRTMSQLSDGAYGKGAAYRNAVINGRLTFRFSGMVVYTLEVGDPIGLAPPWPPTATPGPMPDTTAAPATLAMANDCTFRVRLQDRPDTAEVKIGIAGDPVPPIVLTGPFTSDELTGGFDRTDPDLRPGLLKWGWLTTKDRAGNPYALPEGVPFTPVAPDPDPEPEPPPSDPCASVRTELAAEKIARQGAESAAAAAIAAAQAAEGKLASAKASAAEITAL